MRWLERFGEAMVRFSTVLEGARREKVDAYTKAAAERFQGRLEQQAIQIAELETMNRALALEVAACRRYPEGRHAHEDDGDE